MSVIFKGIGTYYPDNVLSNFDLEKMVDTTDQWISARTGIKERRILPPDDTRNASDLGVSASLEALENAGIKAQELDGIIATAINPDKYFPATACIIQHKLGASGFAFDITAACAGFVFAVNTATALIQSGQCERILVVGAELLSRVVDWNDRNTCVLFGDGAGAVVLSRSDEPNCGVLASRIQSDGSAEQILYLNNSVNSKGPSFMTMDGKSVFKMAVTELTNVVNQTLSDVGLSVDDIDIALFHQANLRILSAVGKRLHLDEDKVFVNGHKFGNTSSASIPLAMADAMSQGKIKKGDLVVLAAIGGGMSWGCNVVRW